jgi:ribosome biogenesis GTPase
VTSVKEGIGVDELRSIIGHDTVTLLGESGAGKSSIVNALLGDDVVTIGDVRESDSKGRHTTTTRELHLLPGVRAVGLIADTDGVAETFVDVDEIASTCRFADCQHEGQPGCAVASALANGTLNAQRVAAWRRLEAETDATEPVTPRSSAPPRRSRRPDER